MGPLLLKDLLTGIEVLFSREYAHLTSNPESFCDVSPRISFVQERQRLFSGVCGFCDDQQVPLDSCLKVFPGYSVKKVSFECHNVKSTCNRPILISPTTTKLIIDQWASACDFANHTRENAIRVSHMFMPVVCLLTSTRSRWSNITFEPLCRQPVEMYVPASFPG